MRTFLVAGASLLLPLASVALPADTKLFDAKLGLWETTTTTEMEGMPAMPAMPQIPKESLDKMPAAQRERVEAMLKNRANPGAPRTMTSKSCTTKETLARGFGVPENKNVDCTRQIVSSSSSKAQIHVECTPAGGGGMKSSGDVAMERIDAEHVNGTMVTKSMAGEKTITVKMSFTSKWVSADCGDVKPYVGK